MKIIPQDFEKGIVKRIIYATMKAVRQYGPVWRGGICGPSCGRHFPQGIWTSEKNSVGGRGAPYRSCAFRSPVGDGQHRLGSPISQGRQIFIEGKASCGTSGGPPCFARCCGLAKGRRRNLDMAVSFWRWRRKIREPSHRIYSQPGRSGRGNAMRVFSKKQSRNKAVTNVFLLT